MTSIKLWIFLFILCSKIKDSYCKGKISINLLEYHNPSGKDAEGKCCDGITIPGCSLGKCDHLFKVCLLNKNSKAPNNCIQSTDIATVDKNDIKFETSQQVLFYFDTWKGEADILVEVYDSNSDDQNNVFIDNFTVTYNATSANHNQSSARSKQYNLTGARQNDPTSLKLSVSVFCDTSYYRYDCSVKCVSTDHCGGHYTCDNQGKKLCKSGWEGADCTVQIPGSEADCSVYTGKKEFVPSSWEGMFTCNGGQHSYPIHLNVTKPKDTTKVQADLSFRNISVDVSGTYSSFSRSLALEISPILIPYEGVNLTGIILQARELNSTNMFGQLTLKMGNRTTDCDLSPFGLKVAYFDGCDFKGTCVRYGQRKEQYYCCCYDGKVGTSCSPTTTPKSTTRPTTLLYSTTLSTTQKPTTRPTTTTVGTTQHPTTKSTTQTPTIKPTTKPPTAEPITQPSTTNLTTQPTTIRPTTAKLTRDKTTTPQPTTETTTIMETSSALPTTRKPTTVKPTTATPRPTTPTTMKMTTKPTRSTSTLPTTAPTTHVLQTTTPMPFSPNATFRVNLLMVDPELDGKDFFSVLKTSWILDNKAVAAMKPDEIEIVYVEYAHTVVHWTPVMVVKYQVKAIQSIPNIQQIREPSSNTIEQQLQLHYKTDKTLLYTESGPFYNLLFSLKFYVQGVGPSNSHIPQWQDAILQALNRSCSSKGKCDIDDETKVVIRMREEYVGDGGIELTEITYFIEKFGVTLSPGNFTGISLDNYADSFKADGINTVIYRGEKTLRFRFHYTLFIEGKVRTEDVTDFELAISNAWNETYPGVYSECKDCYAWIFGREKFVTDSGEEITGLQYFFYFHSMIQPPIDWHPPTITNMTKLIWVTGVDGAPYFLYTQNDYHRYKHSFSLFIEGATDDRNNKAIIDNLHVAVRNYSRGIVADQINTRNFDTTLYVDGIGNYVTEFPIFLTKDKKDLDARLYDLPSAEWLYDWFTKQKVLKKSEKSYTIYKRTSVELYDTKFAWQHLVNDFVHESDTKDIEMVLQDSWNATLPNDDIDVKILTTSMLMFDLDTRKTVTVILYTLRVNGEFQDKDLIAELRKKSTIEMIGNRLHNFHYNTTMSKSLLVPYTQMFELYFLSELSLIDLQTNFSSQLYSALQTKWKTDFRSNLEVSVAFQEKVYIGSIYSEAWRVVFFLTFFENNKTEVVKPDFVSPITETLFYQSLTWMGLGGVEYKLYTQSRTGVSLYRNQHFNLVFTRAVSELDYQHIMKDLQLLWCKYLRCSSNSSIHITITEEEKYLDINGNIYWNLVYFLHQKNRVLDSRCYHGIKLSKDMFKWTNVYNGTYELAEWREMWKYSHGFHLYTDYSVTLQLQYLRSALIKAWFKMGIVSESCHCIDIKITHQKPITDLSGKTFWELTYYILYKGQLIHSTTWPHLDLKLLDISAQKSFTILTNIDTKFYTNLLSFYSNYKLSKTKLTLLERQITNKFLEENTEYKTCRCVSVNIVSQEQVVNSHGETTWRIQYQIIKDRKPLRPSTVRPIDWSTFNYSLTTIHGKHYHFSWTWTDWWKYTHNSLLGGLYLGSWVPPTDYQKFYNALLEYYREYYKGKKVEVGSFNKTKEYYTTIGEKTWRLPFKLTVDGKTVIPATLNTTKFESMLKFNSTSGKTYRLVGGHHTVDTSHVLSVDLNHKVSTKDHNKMKSAIITAWCTEHPEIDPSTITIDILGQEELVNQVTGKSSWKLLYNLSVNNTKVDTRTSTSLTNSQLTSHLNFTSASGALYSIVNTSQTHYQATSVHSLYFRSFLATTDFNAVMKRLKSLWTTKLKDKSMGFGDIDIEFVRQRPFITDSGEKIWKWEYVIKTNTSSLISIPLPSLTFSEIETSFENATSTSESSLVVMNSSASYVDYHKHFSIYLGSKVTTSSIEVFKERIVQAWKNRGVNVTISNLKQEEFVNTVTGQPVWRLAYFLKKGQNIIDSRTEVQLNTTIFHGICGPRGLYHVIKKTDIKESQLLPYSWSSSVIVDHKFSLEAKKKMTLVLTQIVQQKLQLIEENTICNEVPVDIQFLLDSSGSVKSGNFQKQLNFVENFAKVFTIGKNNIQIGVTTFSEKVHHQFYMNSYFEKNELLAAIRRIPYSEGRTYTDLALKWVGEKAFTSQSGDRENAGNILIVMTDGKSHNATKTKTEADKLHQAGIQVFAIGIGRGIEGFELENIASDSENVFKVIGFDALSTIQSKLKQTTCKVSLVNKTVTSEKVKSVTIEINRQEEYLTSTGKRLWKLVYFVKVNGRVVPTTSLPGLDLDKLISKVNITEVNGHKHQVLKIDKSSLYSYRNRFSVFFTQKVTESSLKSLQTALLETWKNTSKEYASCKCLYISNLTKENVEEFVDKSGKSYWRLVYFMKKNNSVVESVTHSSIDLNILKQKIKSIVNQRMEHYHITNITESKLYRSKMAFSFYLTKELGFNQTQQVEMYLKSAWLKKLQITNAEIEVNRYTKYIDMDTKKSLWKVEYYLKQHGSLVDPSVTSKMTDLHLTFTDLKGDNYTIIDPKTAVDSRLRFKIFLNRQLRTKDNSKFCSLLQNYWKTTYGLGVNTTVYVDMVQSEVISERRKYWMLAIFVKEGGIYVDAREKAVLNMTEIQSKITFKGVNSAVYSLHSVEKYKRVDMAFTKYSDKPVKRRSIPWLLKSIKNNLKQTVFNNTENNITVTFGSQEIYLYKKMSKVKISKVLYYVTIDGKEIHPDQLPEIDNGLSTLDKNEIYGFNSLFTIDLKSAVLMTDIKKIESALKRAWGVYRKDWKQTSVEIVSVKHMVAVSSTSYWRLWYRITDNKTTIQSTQEDSITSAVLQANFNVTRGSTSLYYTYASLANTEILEYDSLFSILISQRVAEVDFVKFEAKLKTLWKKRFNTEVKGVKILVQEEVFTLDKKLAWKLSYHVSTTDSTVINKMFDSSPSTTDLQNDVKVTNPVSVLYSVVELDKAYRFSQALSFTLNRRLYIEDNSKFQIAVKRALVSRLSVSSILNISLSDLVESKVVATQTSGSNIFWKYSYIVSKDGTEVDASVQVDSTIEQALQKELKFTTPRKETYSLQTFGSNTEAVLYTDLFYIDFEGITYNEDRSTVVQNVKSYFVNTTTYNSIEVSGVLREDFIEDVAGIHVTRYRFLVKSKMKMVYPSLTPPVNYTHLDIPGLQVYRGTGDLYHVKQLFRLPLQHSTSSSVNLTEVQAVLQNVWKKKKQVNSTVHVVAASKSVSDYGVKLQEIHYAVTYGNRRIAADMEVEPSSKDLGDEIRKHSVAVRVFSFKQYSLNSLYYANVKYSGDLTVTTRQSVENVLRQDIGAASGIKKEKVKTKALLGSNYVSLNSSVNVLKLYFALELKNSTTEPWQKKFAPFNYMLDTAQNVQKDNNVTSVTRPVFELLLKGRIQTNSRFVNAIKTVWNKYSTDKKVSIEILESIVYVDIRWQIVTKVKYAVTVDINDIEQLVETKPFNDKMKSELSGVGAPPCGCGATKLRKHYVYSKSILTSNVTTAISSVWKSVNTGLTDSILSVRVRSQQSRKKRATNKPAHTLVDSNGREVTPLDYTVAVQEEEPKPLFVNIPSGNQMKNPLKQAGSEPCLCKPKLAGSLMLDGQTKDGEKPQVADAIKDAFVKENPEVSKPDLDVEVTGVDNDAKDSDGNPVSEVSYRVGLKDGDVEDLDSPSEAHLQRSLATAGKTLHSRAQKEDDDKDDWIIPLAIAIGILAAVIVIGVVCCVIYKRRHRKDEDLVKREMTIKSNNVFDQEHFSDPAAYDNKAYADTTHPDFSKSAL